MVDDRTKTHDKLRQKAAKIFDHAATIIDKHGWCRYTNKDATGRVCAVGAIIKASPRSFRTAFNHSYNGEKTRPILELFVEHLRARFHDEIYNDKGCGPYLVITQWNDKNAVSGKQVARELRAASKNLSGSE